MWLATLVKIKFCAWAVSLHDTLIEVSSSFRLETDARKRVEKQGHSAYTAPMRLARSSLWVLCLVGCPTPEPAQSIPDEDTSVVSDASVRDSTQRDALGGHDTTQTPCDPVECDTCRFLASEDLFQLGDGDVNPLARTPGIAGNADNFAIVYSTRESGFERIVMSRISTSGGAPTQYALTDTTLTDREPSVVALSDRWLVSWSTNRDGNYEIYTRPHAFDGTPLGAAMRITRDQTEARSDGHPALATDGTHHLLAWTQTETSGAVAPSVFTRTVSSNGELVGPLVPVMRAGRSVGAPTLSQRTGGFALTYADLRSTPSAALLALLSSTGELRAEPDVVSSSGQSTDSQSAVISDSDLAIAAGEGTVLFGVSLLGVRSEIRARPLRTDGTLNTAAMSDRTITDSDEQGADPGITRFSGGYVVAYRSLEGANASWRLRIAFVQTNFNVVRTFDLASVAPAGGRVRVFAHGANFVVAWYDLRQEAGQTRAFLRAARIRC